MHDEPKLEPVCFQVMMVDKDVRRMSVKPKPDGTPPDLARPADILIYEARCCMCFELGPG